MNRLNNKNIRICLCVSLLLFFTGCFGEKEPEPVSEDTLVRVNPSEYPEFTDDMGFDNLDQALENSLTYLNRIPGDRSFRFGGDEYSAAHIKRSLELFRDYVVSRPSGRDLKKFMKKNYLLYKPTGVREGRDPGEVLFTGYYEPFLMGSLTRQEAYPYPVYSKPADLVTVDLSRFSSKFKGEKILGRVSEEGEFVPYFERREIEEKGLLEGRARVIAWVSDPVDLFFLEIQGSGRIYLDTGNSVHVHYQAKNGRPYRAIGRYLIEKGKIPKEKMSMQAIRSYLELHPSEQREIFNYNPSYVFFTLEDEGPLGCLGVPVTPGRTIATDRKIFPPGVLAFIETKKPVMDGEGAIAAWKGFGRFVLNQDTGGAIRGTLRADLFCGSGETAEITAGHMKNPGQMFFMVLDPAKHPL